MNMSSTLRRSVHVAAALLALSCCLPANADDQAKPQRGKKHFYNSYVGKKPPELTGVDAHWVNQTSKVTLEQLHGRVVWLEFNF